MTTASISKANDILARFGQDQVPLIGFCQPSIEAISDEHCEIKISLNTKTQNHVASLYFGTLAVGADITGGFMAMMLAEQSGHYIELLFKDFKADFKKRALADTHFHCHDGLLIQSMIKETLASEERVNKPIKITATTPSITGNECVAEFILTLSLKYKPKTA
jgi:hypothetical protein